ncbi:MAG: protein kinase [Polyangiaceae bacterium]
MSAVAAHKIPERFVAERHLGSGAFGSVWVVWDREREQRVALKHLDCLDPGSIYRFKQEFRALADLRHPNLVRLHELFALDDGWCFTMDLVEGVRFDSWVRGLSRDEPEASAEAPVPSYRAGAAETVLELPAVAGVAANGAPSRREMHWFDADRLRSAVRGLFEGVNALHTAGILHRDLKPSNVLVDAQGRVVILDFGLVATGVSDTHLSLDGNVAGTPAYMSPEQARGAPLTAASDLYAIGAMLYEILAGEVPFDGPMATMLAARTTREPPDPRESWDRLPDDLCELTLSLLRCEPTARPSGAEVAERLGLENKVSVRPRQQAPFVGRERELALLEGAFAATREGRTVVAQVHGVSGQGKTTLVRHFLADLAAKSEVVILDGRCYERESVPFKAFDDFGRRAGALLAAAAPARSRQLHAARRPRALAAVPRAGAARAVRAPEGTPGERRRARASASRVRRATRDLSRISDARPVVLFIDDVQWGDADSAALVRHLLAPPEAPPLLLVVGYRGDGPLDNELLRTLQSPEAVDSGWETVDVPVGVLSSEHCEQLAQLLLAERSEPADAKLIAAESGGSPLFVAELVRGVVSGVAKEGNVSLQRVVSERIRTLPEDTRTALEVLACCERPIDERELRTALSAASGALAQSIDRLRSEFLVSVAVSRDRTLLEVPHDKLRSAVRDGLSPETMRAHHGALAEALAAQGDSDPEAPAHHFHLAENRQQSLLWNERAGDRAMAGAAVDRGVELYERAVAAASGVVKHRLRQKLASALAAAGRGAEAAREFQGLSLESSGEVAAELRKKAAEQFLRAGHVSEAMQLFAQVMADASLSLPSPKAALASLLYHRMRLKLRGLEFRARSHGDLSAAELRNIDLHWMLGSGLAGIDLVRSAHYHTSNLLLSLDAGEPSRVVRALSMHAVMKALESAQGAQQAIVLAERAQRIALDLEQPTALGWAGTARAIAAWGCSEFARCVEYCDDAIHHLREKPEDTFREAGSLEVWFALHSLFLLGDLKRFTERAPACAREAEARGDRYTLSTVRAYDLPLLWAIRDRPHEGRREADAAIEHWPRDAWYHQHWARLRAQCFLDLYDGSAALLERVQGARNNMQRSLQLRIRTLRIEFNYLEGRGILASAAERGLSKSDAQLTRQKIELLEKEKSLLGDVYAQALRAGLEARSQSDGAEDAFVRAGQAFSAASMPLHAAAADLRRGQLIGGTEGKQLGSEAEQRLKELGVQAPARFADMLLPRVAR